MNVNINANSKLTKKGEIDFYLNKNENLPPQKQIFLKDSENLHEINANIDFSDFKELGESPKVINPDTAENPFKQ